MNDMVKNILLWVVIAVVLMSVFNSFGPKVAPSAQMSYSQFLQEAKEGRIAQVMIDGRVRGTTLHGLFEHDSFRTGFLVDLAGRRGKRFVPAGVDFASARLARFDAIADAVETHVDLDALVGLIAQG